AAYPPVNNKTGLLRKCGEVLGGSTGSINYKTDMSFEPNDRCIWVIVPQPGPRSKIMIQVSSIGIYDSDDHLYMMQLVDANGEELPNAPNKTKLVRYQIYEARSREVYIVFYSDSSSQGSGFSLTWSVAG
ncbi:Signal peptide, CUB and EGF-like domain-containing protein 2, partial [Orchesella cincta]